MNENLKAIGPLPVSGVSGGGENVPEVPDVPFRVNKASPNQQALAKIIGWDRLKEIERIDTQPADLQRSPFPPGGATPEIKPRRTRETG